MESGETITVEVITHHAGHDYAKERCLSSEFVVLECMHLRIASLTIHHTSHLSPLSLSNNLPPTLFHYR